MVFDTDFIWDFIGTKILVNETEYMIISIDDSDSNDVILNMKNVKNEENILIIEKDSFRFFIMYGTIQVYSYCFNGIYEKNGILTIERI